MSIAVQELTQAPADAATVTANTAAIAALQAVDLTKADQTTSIIAGAGLTGGGTLAASRTLDVVAGDASIVVSADSITVGVISDAQHGTRTGGTTHAAATDSTAGFMSAADHTQFTLAQLFNPATNQILSASPNPFTGNTFAPIPGGGVVGTATARTPDNTNYGSRKPRLGYVTAAGASSGAIVLFYSAYVNNSGYFSRESGFALKMGSLISAVSANYSWMLGLGVGPDSFSVATPSVRVNTVFVGADSTDTNAQVMYNDGSGSCTKIDLGSSFPARTVGDFYDLLLWCTPGSSTINYTVNRHTSAGTAFASSGTVSGANVPAAGVQWYPMSGCCNGAAGGAVAIDSTGFILAVPL